MAARIMLGLGDFRFEIETAAYGKMERSQSLRWAKQDRVGRLPALQFTGPDLETIKLDGVIYPAFRGGLRQIPLMRAMAATGKPLELVSGTGAVLGLWCILSVGETTELFTDDGLPRKVSFTLQLQHYGDDAPSAPRRPGP